MFFDTFIKDIFSPGNVENEVSTNLKIICDAVFLRDRLMGPKLQHCWENTTAWNTDTIEFLFSKSL